MQLSLDITLLEMQESRLCASESTGSGDILLLSGRSSSQHPLEDCLSFLLFLLLSLVLPSSLLPLMYVFLSLLYMHFAFVSWEITVSRHTFLLVGH